MVKLIAVTQGAGELAGCSAEQIIIHNARVSNPSGQTQFDTGAKLLAYCFRSKHWSVFEQADLTLEITTTIAIATQLLRHKSASFQMHSQRYAEASTYIPVDARRQDLKNRQNSLDDLEPEVTEWFLDQQEELWDVAYNAYKAALNKGVAKECARTLLPQGTSTRLYMKNNVRGWLTYLLVRLDPSTQKEHRDVALACWEEFKKQFPIIAEAVIIEWPEVFS